MERFPRGTLPPTAHPSRTSSAPERRAPSQAEPSRPAEPPRPTEPPRQVSTPSTLKQPSTAAASPRESCDLASTCPNCNTMMQPEHAHYRCLSCGYRDSCCF